MLSSAETEIRFDYLVFEEYFSKTYGDVENSGGLYDSEN